VIHQLKSPLQCGKDAAELAAQPIDPASAVGIQLGLLLVIEQNARPESGHAVGDVDGPERLFVQGQNSASKASSSGSSFATRRDSSRLPSPSRTTQW